MDNNFALSGALIIKLVFATKRRFDSVKIFALFYVDFLIKFACSFHYSKSLKHCFDSVVMSNHDTPIHSPLVDVVNPFESLLLHSKNIIDSFLEWFT